MTWKAIYVKNLGKMGCNFLDHKKARRVTCSTGPRIQETYIDEFIGVFEGAVPEHTSPLPGIAIPTLVLP
jgi:hypothetical protein